MPCHTKKVSFNNPPWLTERGIDLSIIPIDNVLKQAISDNDEEFRSGCSLLASMCGHGRVEAGIFLLGLLQRHPDNIARLILIVDALAAFPSAATVEAFANELRRVKGSSSTRVYLGRIIDALGHFPSNLVDEQIQKLSLDTLVGPRFRQRLKTMIEGGNYY